MKYLIDVLLFLTYAPWLAAYLSLVFPAVRALRQHNSSADSATGILADSIGLTFCALWVLIAPVLMAILAALLGLFGSMGVTIFGGLFFLAGWLHQEKKYRLASVAPLYVIAVLAFYTGLALAMPYSQLALRLPLQLQAWTGANRSF